MHVLIATDAEWVLRELLAALSDDETSFTVCRNGRDVSGFVKGAGRGEGDAEVPDVAVLDLQIGSMGGMAVTMALRLDESAGVLPHVPVVMLLDRVADVHLARRSGAEAWLVKPLDPLRIRRATLAAAGGGTFEDGRPPAPPAAVAAEPAEDDDHGDGGLVEDAEAATTG